LDLAAFGKFIGFSDHRQYRFGKAQKPFQHLAIRILSLVAQVKN